MPIAKNPERTPAYKRIQLAIVKRIESGDLKPGDAVPSERELARCHRVSLMTARHALADLERDGTVERRRGAGTFVAHPKIHFNKLMGYNEQMSEEIDATLADPQVARHLALPHGIPLLRIRQIIYSTRGRPTLHVLGLYRGDRHTLCIRRYR